MMVNVPEPLVFVLLFGKNHPYILATPLNQRKLVVHGELEWPSETQRPE